VIIVDDASDDEHTLHTLATRVMLMVDERAPLWRFVQNAVQIGDGASRNVGASLATGEYLVFVDDDNVPKSHMVRSLVDGIRTSGFDALTCMLDVFSSSSQPIEGVTESLHHWLPLGGIDVSGSVYQNVFGDTNAIIKRRVFERVMGFDGASAVGSAFTDWEFFMHASATSDFTLALYPRPLVWYRLHEQSRLSSVTTAHPRAKTAAHLRALSPLLRHEPHLAAGLLRAKALEMVVSADAFLSSIDSEALARVSSAMGANEPHRRESQPPRTPTSSSLLGFSGEQGLNQWQYGFALVSAAQADSGRYSFVRLGFFDEPTQQWRDRRLPQQIHVGASSMQGGVMRSSSELVWSIRRWSSTRECDARLGITLVADGTRAVDDGSAEQAQQSVAIAVNGRIVWQLDMSLSQARKHSVNVQLQRDDTLDALVIPRMTRSAHPQRNPVDFVVLIYDCDSHER